MKHLFYTTITILLAFLLTSCEIEDNYLITDSYTSFTTKIAYYVDSTAMYKFKFGESTIADSTLVGSSSLETYICTDNLSDTFKVWRYSDDYSSLSLEMDTLITLGEEDVLNLIQLTATSKLCFPPSSTLADSDTTKTSFFFIYNDENQPDTVLIDIIAVDYYQLLIHSNKLAKVSDDYKIAVGSLNLKKGELSTEVKLDLNYYSYINYGLPAQYFYAVYKPDSTLIQDYTTKAKIDIDYTNGTLNPVYKYKIARWSYTSESLPFASPELLSYQFEEEW